MKFFASLFYFFKFIRRENFLLLVTSLTLLFLLLNCSTIFRNTQFLRKKNVKQAVREYQSQNWQVREKAVEKIIQNIRPRNNKFIAVPLILALNDIHNSIRIQALKGLGMIKSPDALAAIKNFIHQQKNGNVKWAAIRTLGLFKDPSSIPIFAAGLDSEDWLIREASIKGLLLIDDAASRSKISPYIIKGLNDENKSVQIATLKNLRIKNREIYQALIKNFQKVKKSQYTLVKAYLFALQGFILDKRIRKKVIGLLSHPNKDIRIYALRVLKKEKTAKKIHD